MPSTLIAAKGGFPDVQILQMFRSVSSGWGCELGARFLLSLTADGMGLADTAAPLHRLPGARSLSQPSRQHWHGQCLQKEGQEGMGRSLLETFPSVNRACPVSCPYLFLLRQKLETRHPSLF